MKKTILLSVLFALLSSVAWAGAAPTEFYLFVDQNHTPSGDGTTWGTAYNSLDDALTTVWAPGNLNKQYVIYVAQGTYKPAKMPYNYADGTHVSSTDQRDKTFHLRSNVVLEGGYPTGGGVFRDASAYPTILSGDINGDDMISGSGLTITPSQMEENVYHVLVISDNNASPVGATIDGFTIKGGNANDDETTYLTVNGMKFYRNGGGGVLIVNGVNTLSNNTLSGNFAANAGAVATPDDDELINDNTIIDNNFSGNVGTMGAGALYISGAHGTVSNNTFLGNVAGGPGGAMIIGDGNHTVSNNTLSGNISAQIGGGLFVGGGIVEINNNTFSENSAFAYGAIYLGQGSQTIISNNTISRNSAGQKVGGLMIDDGTHTLSNNIFWGNIQASSATSQGADFMKSKSSSTIVTFKNNLMQLAASNYTTSGSGRYDLGADAAGNLFAQNPFFVNDSDIDGADDKHRTADDGLALRPCSPAINMGIAVTETMDITGDARVKLGTVDIGAYEAASNTDDQPVNELAPTTVEITLEQTSTATLYGNSCVGIIATVAPSGAHPVEGQYKAKVYVDGSQDPRYAKRHYDIAPADNANTATGTITLYFNPDDFEEFNDASNADLNLPIDREDVTGIANLRIYQEHGTSTTGVPGSYTGWTGSGPANVIIDPDDDKIVWNNEDIRWEVTFDVTGFSGFFLTTSLTPLPVKWLSTSAKLNSKGNAVISWKVEETSVAAYEIQQSASSVDFRPIGSVKGLGDGQHSYSFTQEEVLKGKAYYRIKQTDMDGTVSHSRIMVVGNSDENVAASLYPNPAKDKVTLSLVNSSLLHTSAQLYDAGGRLLQTIPINTQEQSIDINKLSTGIYMLKLQDGTTLRMVK